MNRLRIQLFVLCMCVTALAVVVWCNRRAAEQRLDAIERALKLEQPAPDSAAEEK